MSFVAVGVLRSMRALQLLSIILVAGIFAPLTAQATLTVTPLAWNIVGLDSNVPTAGPKNFPVGARICSNVATSNVAANFIFDSANANINLRAGSLASLNFAAIGANACVDAYFEAEVTQVAAAYDTTRRYHITATDVSGTYSTPTPRELYVEHLISQARNSITNVRYGPNVGSLTAVAPGGSLNLIVGNTYVIELSGGTATQGYEQFEAFINFSNAIFQILSVNTTYSADNSPYVPNPNDKLYADACLWENDPNSPNYRSCIGGDFKAGGSNVVTTYTIKIIGGGGTAQTLNTLLDDFSGSSFHYNGDYSTGARIGNIIDPTTANISKSFSPNPAPVNGISALTITLTNPNAGALSGYNFVDNLPANLVIATPAGATTSGCGTPTLSATAGASTISFSNGTVAANGNCIIKANVTPTATGSLVNTTNDLFIDAVDTGHTATATLTVNNAPPPGTGICGLPLATWRFPTGFNVNTPATTTASVTAAAAAGAGLAPISETTLTADGTAAWGSNGSITTGALVTANNEYFEFGIDTTGLTSVNLNWNMQRRSANGPQGVALFVGTTNTRPETGTQIFSNAAAVPTANTTVNFSQTVNAGLNPSGTTFFRVYSFNSGNVNPGADPVLDDVLFTGCGTGAPATIAKTFTPNPIAINGVSTLTFTLTNPNPSALTSAAFTDSLPAGTQVAATPAAATTCGGTWTPAAAATSLTFSGGIIPASGSCTVSVNVTATTAGPHGNVSGFLSTAETGTNTNSVASATLTALTPPQIAKQFAPSPILPGGTSRLTFSIVNPNPNDAIGGVAFVDTFPAAPGAMVVAGTPNLSTSGCGAPTFTAVAGAGSISFSGGTIVAGGTCVVGVDVTAPAVGTYNNTSGPVSFVINAQTINGNTASDSLVVSPPNPSIGLLKQVGTSPGGPWTAFVAVTPPAPVYYQFTIENTGDVPLSPISLTDNTVDVSSCNAAFASITLPVAVAANNNHIVTCVVGPIATTTGSHTNTAHATGTFNGTPVNSPNSSATYASVGLTLDKTATETTFTNAGDLLHYSYLVTNNGFASLQGPVTVSDNKATVSCPAVSTVGDLDNFLDPGESITCTATYTVTATDVANAGVTNTATATVESTNSNSDSVTVPLSSSADVSVVKTLTTAGPYTVGQSINYTLFVANAGPSTATSVQVTDTPSNLTITNVSGGGCAALPCTIASLASGANVTINVTATINANGAFDNSSTVTAAQPDPNLANNTDNTGNGGTAGVSADVSVVKTLVTAGPYTVGQSLTYTLFVANAGPSTATNVQVTDTPTNLTVTNVSGGGCAALPCTIASLASGANVTITVTATINAVGAFDNASTVSATEPDPDLSNNTDNTGNGGTAGAPQLTVTKSASPTPFVVGQSASYTITVSNTGTAATTTDITIADTLPTGITLTSASGTNWSCAGVSTLSCTFTGTLATSANTVLTLNVAVASSATTGNNTATASGGGDSTCPAAARCSGTVPVGVTAPQLTLSKSASPTPFIVGQPASYTITVSNTGTAATSANITVADTLPTGITLTSASGTNWSCAGASTLSCTFTGTLAASANTVLTLNVAVASSATTGNNTATASGGGDSTCPAAARCSGTVPVGVTAPQLTVTKSASPTPFTVGVPASYTVIVTNSGNATTSGNIIVSDTLPTGITLTSASGTNWSCTGTTALSCTFTGTLAPSAGTTLTLNVSVGASATTGNNTASASGGGDTTCPAAARCSGTVPVGVVAPQLSTSKSGVLDNSIVAPSTESNPGDTITYTITVANGGTGVATGVSVTDALLASLNCTIGGSPVTLPTNLNAGASLVCTSTYTLTAGDISAGSVTNTATTSAGNVCNPTTAGSTCSGTSVTPLTLTPVLSTSKTGVLNNAVVAPSNQSDPGDQINYTITVTNSGNGPATGVSVSDTKIPVLTCTISGNPAPLPTTIPAGAALICTGTYTLTSADITNGSVTNTATVSGSNVCPPGTGCADTEITPLGVVPVLALTKTASPNPFVVGQPASYTITVTNNGSAATTAPISIADNLPSGITLASATGTSWTCTGTTSLTCTFSGTLNAAANTVLTLNVTVASSATTGDNTATASGGGDSTCPAAARCSDTVPVTVTVPLLSVSKTATPNPFVVGQPASYTVTIVNSGSAATFGNIVVTDVLPTGISLTGATGTNWTCTGTTSLTCTFTGTLAVGANTMLTLDVSVAASATTATNTATASGGGDSTCPAAAHCSGTVPASVAAPLLTVTKSASPNPFVISQPASYTITVANSGTATTVGNIIVTDTLPTGITLTSASGTNWTCTGTTALTCTFTGTLAPTASTALTLNVTVGPTATSGNNTATASGGGDSTCPAAAHCSGTVLTGSAAPLLTVTKSASPRPFVIGQAASYTVTVANTGTAATVGNITLSDTLPTGITLATYVGTNWTCAGTTAVTCTFSGTLAQSASTALTLNVSVGPTATTGNNTATASGGGDATCPAAAHCSGTVTVGIVTANQTAAPVPVDARWALWLLMLSVLAVAAAMRRRAE